MELGEGIMKTCLLGRLALGIYKEGRAEGIKEMLKPCLVISPDHLWMGAG